MINICFLLGTVLCSNLNNMNSQVYSCNNLLFVSCISVLNEICCQYFSKSLFLITKFHLRICSTQTLHSCSDSKLRVMGVCRFLVL